MKPSISRTRTVTTDSPFVQGIKSYGIFLVIALGLLILDQFTKLAIIHFSGFSRGLYPPFGGMEIIPGYFNLVYAVNAGAAWGIFQGQRWQLVSLALIVLVVLIFFRRQLELEKRSHQMFFGLIVGGILGNTIDRIAYGHVVDFLDVNLQIYRWPTFNIADCGIVMGALLFLLSGFVTTKGNEAMKQARNSS